MPLLFGRDVIHGHRTEISDYTLRNTYLPAFRAAVRAGVKTVMSSFNELSGQPVTSSHYLLTEVLRGELGFRGFVVSDWNSVEQLQTQGVAGSRRECARQALLAGVDMDMVDNCYAEELTALVRDGEVPMEALEEAVRRVLRVKAELGLFESPLRPELPIDWAAHRAQARRFVAESAVLLENHADALPLAKSGCIAVIGPMAHERGSLLGAWTLDGVAGETPTLVEAVRAVAPGAKLTTCESGLYDDMLIAARNADVIVLVLGESSAVTGEAHSLADVSLPAAQRALAERVRMLGKRVIGVLFFSVARSRWRAAIGCSTRCYMRSTAAAKLRTA